MSLLPGLQKVILMGKVRSLQRRGDQGFLVLTIPGRTEEFDVRVLCEGYRFTDRVFALWKPGKSLLIEGALEKGQKGLYVVASSWDFGEDRVERVVDLSGARP